MVRRPSVVMPPSLGPSGPPRLICMIVMGGSCLAPNHAAGRNKKAPTSATCATIDAPSIGLRPSPFGVRATRTSLTASMSLLLRAPLLSDDADFFDAGL